MTVTTNQGKVRIERPYPRVSKSVEGKQFSIHRANEKSTVNIDGLTVDFKRVGHAWAPPSTNTQNSYQSNIPATFYRANLKPLSIEELSREVPGKWNQSLGCRNNLNAFRFYFEIKGGVWKFLSATLFDARTQVVLTPGYSSSSSGESLQLNLDPWIWHPTPVDIVIDFAAGPVEVEEILPQVGSVFTAESVSYHLIFTGGNISSRSQSSGVDGKVEYWEMPLVTSQSGQKKECVFVFAGDAALSDPGFEFDFLDVNGKPLESSGSSRFNEFIQLGVYGDLTEIRQIRVRKYIARHRIIYRLSSLPGLPSNNQKIDNLFRVQAPVLRFNFEYEQKEFIQRVTQLELRNFPYTNLPTGTYPRYFTNATVADVLQDYEKLMGVQGQAYVNQETLQIEIGKKPWPLEMAEKVRKFVNKILKP